MSNYEYVSATAFRLDGELVDLNIVNQVCGNVGGAKLHQAMQIVTVLVNNHTLLQKTLLQEHRDRLLQYTADRWCEFQKLQITTRSRSRGMYAGVTR